MRSSSPMSISWTKSCWREVPKGSSEIQFQDCWVRTLSASARPFAVGPHRNGDRKRLQEAEGTHHQHQHSECSPPSLPWKDTEGGNSVVEVVGSVKTHCRSAGTLREIVEWARPGLGGWPLVQCCVRTCTSTSAVACAVGGESGRPWLSQHATQETSTLQ